ncbi:ABC-type transport auxiliary lipoprotein family protein [Propionivibrio limicola]|uniref:ABC-type transport auxiliary lipoprotein family protein n=1 Tax=Propionivibrio limicola TaxID=167645 RepID=UPI001291E1B5|nr:ABC-type transport auxiliary lipoprotein family protein [Propionivibrio limicola]
MRYRFIFCAALLLGGCAGGIRNDASAIYDFGLPAQPLGAGWPKLVVDVKAPAWFDALPVDYRLAYDDPLKLREYATSRWAGAPASLLAQHLRQQLGANGSSASTAVECLLRIDLLEFSHVFDAAEKSRGVLHARATLIDGKRQVLATRSHTIEQAAATPNAAGGVRALVDAGEALGREIDGWMTQLEKGGRLQGCQRGRSGA